MHKTHWRMHSCSIQQVPKEPSAKAGKSFSGVLLPLAKVRSVTLELPSASRFPPSQSSDNLQDLEAETTQESQRGPESR